MRHWQDLGRVPRNSSVNWDQKRILFVSGKGGVGKSLVAAAIAQEQAKKGRRVLLVEVGDKSYYKDFWSLPSVGHDPVRAPGGFDLALWSGESCLREYVLFYLKMERLYRLFFENKVMRALVNVAPGLSEIAILGKITSGIRRVGPSLDYDLIVVDSYATGHALALLLAPKGMMEAIKFGPMGAHSRDMDRVIRDPSLTSYAIVSLLEEMPVVETLEFSEKLEKELGTKASIIANKFLVRPATSDELKSLEEKDPAGIGEFARYIRAIGERQESFLEALSQSGSRSGELIACIPLIFSADPEVLVREAGEALRQV